MTDEDREDLIEAVRRAKTVDEVFAALGISSVSPEAYCAEVVWEALREGNKHGER